MSPIINGLELVFPEPVTDYSFFRQTPHRACQYPFCAQILGSQVACLHFRQFFESCKCTATKTAFPTATAGFCWRLFRRQHDKGCAPTKRLSTIFTRI